MKKGFIPALILTLLAVTTGYFAYNKVEPRLGAFSDTFLSIQLAPSPNNGDCLTTDGTDNVWDTCAGGEGGSSLHVDGGGFVYPQTGDYHSAPYYAATSTTATSTFAGGITGPNNFVVQQGSGNVGVGTLTPAQALTVVGNAQISDELRFTDATPIIRYSTTARLLDIQGGTIRLNGDSNLDVAVVTDAGTDSLFVQNTTGNVGIGTSSPYARLSVVGETVAEYFTATSTTASTFNNASTTLLSGTTAWFTNFIGNLTGNVTGNADTATSLAANGTNASAGNAILGVDASGNAEGAFDVWTEAENTAAAYISDLTGFDTGDLTEGSNLYFTDARVGSYLTGSSTLGLFLATHCEDITGGSGLCDGTDNTGGGGGLATSTAIADTEVIFGTSASDVGSEAAFTYNDATNALTVQGTTTVNALQSGSTAIGSNVAKFSPLTGLTTSNSESVGGVVNIALGTTDTIGLAAYTNGAGSQRLGSFVCDSASYSGNCLHVRSDGTTSALNVLGAPTGQGLIKAGANGAGDADASILSLDASVNGFLGQLLFGKCGTSTICTQIRNSANSPIFDIYGNGRFSVGSSTATGLATLTVSATSTDTTKLASFLNDTNTEVASLTDEGLLTLATVLPVGSGGNIFDFDSNTPAGIPQDSVYRIRHGFDNFIANSSFESWLSGTSVAPDAWTLQGDATVARVADPSVGTYAAEITFGTANTGELYQAIPIHTSVDYTFSCYVERTSGTGSARLVAQENGDDFTEYVSVNLNTGSGKQLAVLTVQPATAGEMRINIKSGDTTASTWVIDECMVEEGAGVASTYTPAYHNDTDAWTAYGTTTFAGQFNLGSQGINFSNDGDGAMTWVGLGNGNDESITWNLDDTANTVDITSTTGVTVFDFSDFTGRFNRLGINDTAQTSNALEVLTDSTITTGMRVEGDVSTRNAATSFVTGEGQLRFIRRIDGLMSWGDGSSVADTNLFRDSANTLRTNDSFTVDSALNVGSSAFAVNSSGAITAITGISGATGVYDLGGATSFELPNNGTVNANGEITTDDTSGQLRYYAGNAERVISPEYSRTLGSVGSTSPDRVLNTFASATTTWSFGHTNGAVTVTSLYADTDTGTCLMRVGDGSNWSAAVVGDSDGQELTGLSNNTFTDREEILIQIGTCASSPNFFTPTLTFTTTAD